MRWKIDPYLNLGPLLIKWYTIFLALAILIPYLLIRRKSQQFNVKKAEIDNLLLILVPTGIVGARLYHVIDKWSYYQNHLVEILYIWQGGLGIFGALLVGGLVSWYYCKVKKIDLVNLLDLVLPYLLLGQGIGRVGNYFNSEGYGPPTTLPWGVMINGQNVHPTFFYEALWDLVGAVILIKLRLRLKKGQLISFYLVIYGLGRLVAEVFRIDTFEVSGFKLGYAIATSLILVGLFLLAKFTRIVKPEKR